MGREPKQEEVELLNRVIQHALEEFRAKLQTQS
jgi:hypothetical protein